MRYAAICLWRECRSAPFRSWPRRLCLRSAWRDIQAGKRQEDVIGRSLAYLPMYREMDAIPICTDNKSVEEISDEIRSFL